MTNLLSIKPLCDSDIDFVTEISKKEGFAPGIGDYSELLNLSNNGNIFYFVD